MSSPIAQRVVVIARPRRRFARLALLLVGAAISVKGFERQRLLLPRPNHNPVMVDPVERAPQGVSLRAALDWLRKSARQGYWCPQVFPGGRFTTRGA